MWLIVMSSSHRVCRGRSFLFLYFFQVVFCVEPNQTLTTVATNQTMLLFFKFTLKRHSQMMSCCWYWIRLENACLCQSGGRLQTMFLIFNLMTCLTSQRVTERNCAHKEIILSRNVIFKTSVSNSLSFGSTFLPLSVTTSQVCSGFCRHMTLDLLRAISWASVDFLPCVCLLSDDNVDASQRDIPVLPRRKTLLCQHLEKVRSISR